VRKLAVVVTCVGLLSSGTAQAQMSIPGVGAVTANMLMPNPLGIILMVGQWIIFENEKTYYIEVIGEGTSIRESQMNGFRLGVEQAVGSVIASETHVANDRIKRDEVISYASGYVNKFEVVKVENKNNIVQTTMKLWIKRSPLANRLLAESTGRAQVDGPRIAAVDITINEQFRNGQKLLGTVLNDYPQRSFKVEIGKTSLSVTGNRQSMISIPFTVEWDSRYLDALFASIKPAAVDRGWFCGTGCANDYKINNLHFDSDQYYRQITTRFTSVGAIPRVTIRDAHNRIVYRACQENTAQTRNPDVFLFSTARDYRREFVISTPKLPMMAQIPYSETLNDAARVEVEIVASSNCSTQLTGAK